MWVGFAVARAVGAADDSDGQAAARLKEATTHVAEAWAGAAIGAAAIAVVLLVIAVKRGAFAGRAHAVGVLPTPAAALLAVFGYFAFMLAAVLGNAVFALVVPDVAKPLAPLVANLLATAAVLLLARRALGVGVAAHGLHGRNLGGALTVAALVYLAAMPVFYLLTALPLGRPDPQRQVLEIAESTNPAFLALYAVAVSVTVPLFEELLFRGVALPALRRVFGVAGGIVSSAVLFTIVHEVQTWPAIFWLGLALGFAYHYTGSLMAPLAIHAVHNASQFALVLAVR